MATLFLDTFDGSGVLANRTPNTGPAWGSFDVVGSVSGGVLSSALVSTTYRTTGRVVMPEYGGLSVPALTFRFLYAVSNLDDTALSAFFDQGMFGELFSLDYRSGANTLTTLLGAVDITGLSKVATREIIVSFDYDADTVGVYIDGAEYQIGTIPGGEDDFTPQPNQKYAWNISSFAEFSTSQPNPLTLLELEITDVPYAPEVSLFWTDRVRCQEIP